MASPFCCLDSRKTPRACLQDSIAACVFPCFEFSSHSFSNRLASGIGLACCENAGETKEASAGIENRKRRTMLLAKRRENNGRKASTLPVGRLGRNPQRIGHVLCITATLQIVSPRCGPAMPRATNGSRSIRSTRSRERYARAVLHEFHHQPN